MDFIYSSGCSLVVTTMFAHAQSSCGLLPVSLPADVREEAAATCPPEAEALPFSSLLLGGLLGLLNDFLDAVLIAQFL